MTGSYSIGRPLLLPRLSLRKRSVASRFVLRHDLTGLSKVCFVDLSIHLDHSGNLLSYERVSLLSPLVDADCKKKSKSDENEGER